MESPIGRSGAWVGEDDNFHAARFEKDGTFYRKPCKFSCLLCWHGILGYLVARRNASGGKNDADASKNLDNRFARAQARRWLGQAVAGAKQKHAPWILLGQQYGIWTSKRKKDLMRWPWSLRGWKVIEPYFSLGLHRNESAVADSPLVPSQDGNHVVNQPGFHWKWKISIHGNLRAPPKHLTFPRK